MADWKPEIVQQRSDGVCFLVTLANDFVGDDEAKEERPDDVVVCVVGRVLSRKLYRFGDEGCVWYSYASKDSSGQSCSGRHFER